MTYIEAIALYEAGLISREEVNKAVAMLNMGSDTTTYREV